MSTATSPVALVTGSRRGIGRAIAERLAAEGMDLAIHGRQATGPSADTAESLCESLRATGRRAHAFHADIGQKAEVKALMDEVRTTFGRLDVLVLNAARSEFKESHRLLERHLRQLVETNILGHVFCMQQALPLLEEAGGRIVFISSLGSRFMSPSYPLGPMKAAMEAQVRDWAEELGPRGVRSNAVCAGLVKTDAYKTLRRIWPGLDQLPESSFVTPEEVAAAVAFLVGPDAGGVNGQTLVVDRGISNRLLRW